MRAPPTVLATWLMSVLDLFEARGLTLARLNGGEWLREAAERNPTRPLQLVAVRRLWHQAMQCRDDPTFGLEVGLSLPLQAMNVVAWLVMHSPNLRQGLTEAIRFQSLISNSGQFELVPHALGALVQYRITPAAVSMHPAQVDSAFGGLLGLLRLCGPRSLRPLSMVLPGISPGTAKNYADLLQCEVKAPEQHPGMLIAQVDLDRPFPAADPVLLQLALRRAQDMRRAQVRSDSLVDHVQASLVSHGLEQASCATTARALGLSVRTLQRRLAECNTNFRRLLEATRMEEALRLLADRAMPLITISETLGYADVSALSHAVRSHWGDSPRRLREEMVAKENLPR